MAVIRVQLRRDTATNWTTLNPILYDGEIGIEKVTDRLKIGNGTDAWNDLDYYSTPSAVILDGDYGAITITGGVWALDSGINANLIANGSVSNAEFQYINSLSSNAQDQIDSKLSISTAASTYEPIITAGSSGQYYRFDKTWAALNKAAVGLSNVDNTSDANKPISTATQTALDAKQDTITGAATTVVSSNLTINRALIANASGKIAVSTTTDTELSYLSGANSNIQDQIDDKSDIGHTHTASEITDFSAATDARISLQKASNNGLATLDGSGKIPSSQLPAIAISDTFVVASQAAMLALTAETGDVAVRTDQNKSYILKGTSASTLADWQELLTPTDSVLSVNGQTGSVVLTTSNISEGSNLYYTDARARAAISVSGAPLHYSSGVISIDTANGSQPGVISATDWNTFNNKQDAFSTASLSTSTSGVSITGANNLVTNAGTINIATASGSQQGLLSATDWNTFNNKQAAGNYITALTGDATASGPGSSALTLATVNSNVGTYGASNKTVALTVNAKGLITAASEATISITSSNVSDFTEAAQDAVGNAFDSTLVYTDGSNSIGRAALTGEATAAAGSNAITLTNSAVIGKVLTGYTSGAGTVAATDTILQAIQKLNGNIALKAPLLDPVFVGSTSNTSAYGAKFQNSSNTDLLTIKNDGSIAIGTTSSYLAGPSLLIYTSTNGLLYSDIQNPNTGSAAGSILRLISSNVAGSGTVSGSIIKYKDGRMIITNDETDSTAYLGFAVGGTTRGRFTSAGFLNIGGVAGYPIYVGLAATFADVMMKLNNTGSTISKIALGNTSTSYDAEIGAEGNNFFVNNTGTRRLEITTGGAAITGSVFSSDGIQIGVTSDVGLSSQIYATRSSGSVAMYMDAFGGAGNIIARRGQGTSSSPTALTADLAMLFLGTRGYYQTSGTPTGWTSVNTGAIQIKAAGTYTNTDYGCYYTIELTPVGSTTRAEVFRVNPSGYVGILNNNPQAPLQITAAGITAIRFGDNTNDYTFGRNSTDGLLYISGTQAAPYSGYVFRTQGTVEVLKVTSGGNLFMPVVGSYMVIGASSLPASSSAAQLYITNAAASGAQITLDVFANSSNFSNLRANGTLASPTALASGDVMSFYGVKGYYSTSGTPTGYSGNVGALRFVTSEAYTHTGQGNYFEIATTAIGATTRSVVATFQAGYGATITGQVYANNTIKAFVNFNGSGTVAIKGTSHNVSSITDNGTGYYTINYGTALPSTNYVCGGMGVDAEGGVTTVKLRSTNSTSNPTTKTTTATAIGVGYGSATDCVDVSFFCMGV